MTCSDTSISYHDNNASEERTAEYSNNYPAPLNNLYRTPLFCVLLHFCCLALPRSYPHQLTSIRRAGNEQNTFCYFVCMLFTVAFHFLDCHKRQILSQEFDMKIPILVRGFEFTVYYMKLQIFCLNVLTSTMRNEFEVS